MGIEETSGSHQSPVSVIGPANPNLEISRLIDKRTLVTDAKKNSPPPLQKHRRKTVSEPSNRSHAYRTRRGTYSPNPPYLSLPNLTPSSSWNSSTTATPKSVKLVRKPLHTQHRHTHQTDSTQQLPNTSSATAKPTPRSSNANN